MELEYKIILILNDICGADEGELSPDLDLFEAGLLDSFAVIQLFIELEEMFDVSLKIEEITRDKITTPLKIAGLIREVRGFA